MLGQTPYERSVLRLQMYGSDHPQSFAKKLLQIVTSRGLDGRVDVGIR